MRAQYVGCVFVLHTHACGYSGLESLCCTELLAVFHRKSIDDRRLRRQNDQFIEGQHQYSNETSTKYCIDRIRTYFHNSVRHRILTSGTFRV